MARILGPDLCHAMLLQQFGQQKAMAHAGIIDDGARDGDVVAIAQRLTMPLPGMGPNGLREFGAAASGRLVFMPEAHAPWLPERCPLHQHWWFPLDIDFTMRPA